MFCESAEVIYEAYPILAILCAKVINEAFDVMKALLKSYFLQILKFITSIFVAIRDVNGIKKIAIIRINPNFSLTKIDEIINPPLTF